MLCTNEAESFGAILRNQHMASFAPKPFRDDRAPIWLIVDYQHGGVLQLHFSPPRGRVKEKQVWFSNSESVSCPPCSSTIDFDKLSPSPVPLPTGLVVKNGSMMRALSSGGTPGPLSITAKTAEFSRLVTSRRIHLAPGHSITASNAFWSRLSKTWAICTSRQKTRSPGSTAVVSS